MVFNNNITRCILKIIDYYFFKKTILFKTRDHLNISVLVNRLLIFPQKQFVLNKKASSVRLEFSEAPVGFEPTSKGFADLPLKPLGYSAIIKKKKTPNLKNKIHFRGFRAGNGTRTRDINLGKVALYQLSYSRKQIL
jgi:hypothetical protein